MKRKIFLMLLILLICITCISTFVYSDNSNIQELKSDNIVTIKSDTNENTANSEDFYTIKENPDVPRLVVENNEDNINLLAAAAPEGCLDFVNADRMAGWAWRPDLPNNPIDIHVYFNNITTGQNFGPYPFSANFYRADLQAAGIGNGYHGFDLLVNWNTLPPGLYDVVVYAIGDGYNPSLTNCPMNYTVTKPEGCLDRANLHSIAGWAWRSSEPKEPIDVYIKITGPDGTERTETVKANNYRADLVNINGNGTGSYGFDFNPDWSNYPAGTYKVEVFGIGANNDMYQLTNSPKGYTVFASVFGTDISNHPYFDDLNTRTDVNIVADALESCGYTNTRRLIDPSLLVIQSNLVSRVQFFSCHGDYDNVQMKNGGIWTLNEEGNSLQGIEMLNFDFVKKLWNDNTKLITFFACNSAGRNGEIYENSITYRSVDETNLEAAVGFTKTIIGKDNANRWAKRYSEKLAEGYGVCDAVQYANSTIYVNENIKSNCIVHKGDDNITINTLPMRSKQKANTLDNINILNNKKILETEENKIISSIIEKNPKFNINNYEVSKVDGATSINAKTGEITNNTTYIDYKLKIGEFYTEAGYTVEINDGIVTAIYDNNIDLEKQEKAIQNVDSFKICNKETENSLKNKAISTISKKYANYESKINVEENNVTYYYDIENDKKYMIITIENKMVRGNAIGYYYEDVFYEL